jgi:hypothetical protein
VIPAVFSEDVVLGGLKAGPFWFISDYLLQMDSRSGQAEDEPTIETLNRNRDC